MLSLPLPFPLCIFISLLVAYSRALTLSNSLPPHAREEYQTTTSVVVLLLTCSLPAVFSPLSRECDDHGSLWCNIFGKKNCRMCADDCEAYCEGKTSCRCHPCPVSGATETWPCTVGKPLACYDEVRQVFRPVFSRDVVCTGLAQTTKWLHRSAKRVFSVVDLHTVPSEPRRWQSPDVVQHGTRAYAVQRRTLNE